jgi:alanine racemase
VSAVPDSTPRRAVAPVNLAAIGRNVATLAAAAPTALVCAVVKADGYGHGAVPAARAARAHGASWLAVAAAHEATTLRDAGLGGPILVLGALGPEELAEAVAAEADVVVWREDQVAAAAAFDANVGVHVKLDTGMGRLGTRDPEEALRTAEAANATPGVRLAGAMTHFATADERGDGFFDEQLGRFTAWLERVRALAPEVLAHAANSAALLRDDATHFDMVRPGVAIYGLDPFGEDPALRGLEPALELHSWVAEVKPAAAGESVGYGRRFVAAEPTRIATVPVGYGDGWRRGLTNDADVLVRGARQPLVGTVSMDNITLDLGPAGPVTRGDAAVLVGRQGEERILAEEVALRLGTINYEVTCGLTARVPRRYHRDGLTLAG